MLCKHCQAEVHVLDTSCPSCGKSLSLLDESPPQASASNSFLDKVSEEIDSELGKVERELLSDSRISEDFSGEIGQGKHDTLRRPPSAEGSSWRLATLSRPAELDLFESEGLALETTHADIQQIAKFVFYSGHVQSNLMYRHRAGETTLRYLPEVGVVNAFATDENLPGLDVDPPLIVVFGGMTTATRLAAIALGLERTIQTPASKETLVATIRGIGNSIVKHQGTFSFDNAKSIASDLKLNDLAANGEVFRKAHSYSAAMNMAIIAHELGHIALGHTLGKQLSHEISRNQEREADSFASSVASASPFSDYIVAGGIFWWIIMTWVESAAGSHVQTTHPHARERLMDYIRANREQAVEMGIDEETLLDFMP